MHEDGNPYRASQLPADAGRGWPDLAPAVLFAVGWLAAHAIQQWLTKLW